MDCQQCGQQKAKVQYTEVVGADKQVQWLCAACAESRGLLIVKTTAPVPAIPDAAVRASLRKRCPTCETSLGAIRRSGRVGCPECYLTFQEHLESLLRRVHGALKHSGRRRAAGDEPALRRLELLRLRSDLERAVADEDFEAAARLRDAIDRAEATTPRREDLA